MLIVVPTGDEELAGNFGHLDNSLPVNHAYLKTPYWIYLVLFTTVLNKKLSYR